MGLFDNLFGRKKPRPQKSQPPSFKPAVLPPKKADAVADPSKDPNLIRVFDGYGREMFIPKEEWRTKVLPDTLKSNWNNAGQLAGLIVSSLNDGFFPDVLAAAEHLHRMDPLSAQSACIYAIVLMKNHRLEEAENVLRDHLKKNGEDGSILTNLAKVYAERKNHEKALETLWHALEVDPNQDNGMGWYEAIHREKGGPEAGLEALQRLAALPGSWRPQLWLARHALQTRKTEEALKLYRDCLNRVGNPVPADLLMQMSGDLGNTGHLPEILQLVAPHFDARTHGLPVGNNLIRANLDLGQLDAARRILDQLYALNRMDWKQTLSFWDTEIGKAQVASTNPVPQAELQITMLTNEGPIWLKPSSPAAELFPVKLPESLVIAFIGSSVETPTNSKRVERQMADDKGRFSRALPMFFAEQVEFHSRARSQTLMPWITNEGGGFVLSGVPWKDEDAANYSRQTQVKSDYVVVCHLKAPSEIWTLELRLVRSIDGKCLATIEDSFPSTSPQSAVFDLAERLLGMLSEHAEVELQPAPQLYEVPKGGQLPFYLVRLEQLLAVRCSSMEGASKSLHGERDILDGNLQFCASNPQNVCTRILLAQTLLAMKRVRPDVIPEFKEKIGLIQKEKPLSEPARGVIQRMFDEALAS